MELDGGREEGGADPVVQRQRPVHRLGGQALDGSREPCIGHVLRQDAGVDGVQRVLIGEADGEHGKVTLGGGKQIDR